MAWGGCLRRPAFGAVGSPQVNVSNSGATCMACPTIAERRLTGKYSEKAVPHSPFVSICAQANPCIVGNRHEFEGAIFKQGTLHPSRTGIDSNTQKHHAHAGNTSMFSSSHDRVHFRYGRSAPGRRCRIKRRVHVNVKFGSPTSIEAGLLVFSLT